jgi:hypothetical protein
MKGERSGKKKIEQRVELKYCERCGALGLRECSGGQVYCSHCLPEVEDLPAATRTPDPRMRMPVGRSTVFDSDDYEFDIDEDDAVDFEAEGVA